MIAAINKEINLFEYSGEIIDTIYFGGGTPSLLDDEDLNTILRTVQNNFTLSGDAEITLEANPDDINATTLSKWKIMGINRLSVGIQSFLEEELKWMNRAHNAEQSLQCLELIKNAGFKNFSVDLIYGSPLLSNEALKRNVDVILKNNVPHISCYALTVESKTALDHMIRQNRSLPVDGNKQSEQFLLLMKWLGSAGYEHYEISNFSKPGMRSRHNSSYWKGKPYYGFGPSAHSFDGKNIRKWNVANNSLYLLSLEQNIIPYTEEILTQTQQLNEYIMISLRTAEGLDLGTVAKKFGDDRKDEIAKQSKKYIRSGCMIYDHSNLKLTDEGKLLADGISADLFVTEGSVQTLPTDEMQG